MDSRERNKMEKNDMTPLNTEDYGAAQEQRWGAIWDDTERKNEAWDGVKHGLFDISSHAERCV